MYRVLIVDDEPEIRQGLQLKVSFESLGFYVASEASNGREALEKLANEPIDVVITDMNMPIMDGMTFMDACHELIPSLRLIVITGYEDFHYAKAAIRNQARDYLLKPVTRDELTKSLVGVRNELDRDRNNQDQAALIQWRLSQYYKEMKEHYIVHLVKEELVQTPLILERSRLFELEEWNHGQVRFLTLGLKDQTGPAGENNRTEDAFRLPFEMVVRECAAMQHASMQVFRDLNYPGLMHVVLQEDAELVRTFTEALEDHVRSLMRFDLRIGVGQAVTGFKQWKEGYMSSLLAWSLPYDGRKDETRSTAAQGEQADHALKVIERYLVRGELAAFQAAIRQELVAAHGSRPRFVKTIFQLYLMLEPIAKASHTALEGGEQLWLRPEMTLTLDSVEKAERFLMGIADRIERNRQNESDETDPFLFIKAAQQFIDENYMYDLNLSMIAEKFNYNASYFSEIFKAKTGKAFIHYLNETRMGEAIHLLQNTTLTLWDIAELTGFSNASYFSSKFKRMYGVTPSEFRLRPSEKNDSEHPKN
ncbi:response regulator [Paenibacillus sp. 2TAB23]|uniref:response regulator transcription factor n=1 Tax=Paenibacillus sp. 2TAB23 TaxID=3233004 RepID=UPI003F971F18